MRGANGGESTKTLDRVYDRELGGEEEGEGRCSDV